MPENESPDRYIWTDGEPSKVYPRSMSKLTYWTKPRGATMDPLLPLGIAIGFVIVAVVIDLVGAG